MHSVDTAIAITITIAVFARTRTSFHPLLLDCTHSQLLFLLQLRRTHGIHIRITLRVIIVMTTTTRGSSLR